MLSIPGIALGTLVQNNVTYPFFFLLSKDFLYGTCQSQSFHQSSLLFS